MLLATVEAPLSRLIGGMTREFNHIRRFRPTTYGNDMFLHLEGTLEERGMIAWKRGEINRRGDGTVNDSCYDIPIKGYK